MCPRTTQNSCNEDDCCIDSGYFVLYQSRDYPYINYANKYSSYYSLYYIQYNYFSGSGDVRGSGGNSTTYFSHKVYFGRYRCDVVFSTYQNHCKESLVVTSLSNDSSVGYTVGCTFSFRWW